jgi:hypothetical protein
VWRGTVPGPVADQTTAHEITALASPSGFVGVQLKSTVALKSRRSIENLVSTPLLGMNLVRVCKVIQTFLRIIVLLHTSI